MRSGPVEFATDRADLSPPPGVSVVREIGRGAQSVVYHVVRDGVGYAMKVLPGGADPAARAAFRREAALLANADHPRLAAIHDVGEMADRPYLIMDLFEGVALTGHLRSGPMAEASIRTLGIELADVLAAVHRVGLVHHDVKPDNILVMPDGSARLIDFGMASRGTRNAGDRLAGTIAYASPEQGGILKRRVDPRSDLYCLGVVLYECAAGRVPFASSDAGELLRLHATSTPPDLHGLRPDLSAHLVAVIGRLLAKDPDDRYADCADLIAALYADAPDANASHADASHADAPAGAEPSPVTPRPATVVARPRTPLVGRDGELADLTAQWADVRGGAGRLVTVRGASGSGKSRLLTEFRRSVSGGDAPVLVLHCVEGAAPLAPFTAAVEGYLDDVDAIGDVEQRDRATALIRAAAGVGAPFLRRLSPSLAAVLDDQPEPAELPPDGFPHALSGFVVGLAAAGGGAVLIVDDGHRCDSATARVLQRVVAELADAPLLVIVATVGSDEAPDPSWHTAARTPDLDLTLGPLSRPALVCLAGELAGRFGLGTELLERIVARSGGTPLGVLEYFGAVIDAGLLVPRWGTWVLDVDGLDQLGLPDDTVGLLVRRIDNLGPRARRLLTAAATVGVHFGPRLPTLLGVAADEATATDESAGAFDEAIAQGILERRRDGYAFVHERIRFALLDATPDEHRADLHERAAELLIPQDCPDGSAYVYALARHRMAGHPDRHRDAVYAACLHAGQRAIDDYAPGDAVRFLEHARSFAGTRSPAEQAVLHEALGTAYHLNFRLAEATAALDAALRCATGPLDRARILEQHARLHLAGWRLDRTMTAVRAGLTELGLPLPTNPVWLLISTVAMLIGSVFVIRTGIGFGTVDPGRAARYRLASALYTVGAHTSVRALRPEQTLVMDFRCRFFVSRLGPSDDLVKAIAGWACFVQTITGKRNDRGFDRAARLAAEIGSPAAASYAEGMRRGTDAMTAQPAVERDLRWLKQNRPFVDSSNAMDLLNIMLSRLLLQGRSTEALATYRLGATLLDGAEQGVTPFGQLGLAVSATLGQTVDARGALVPLADAVPAAATRGGLLALLGPSFILAVEQREFGETFDRLVAALAALRINPRTLVPPLRPIFASVAYGRLEQCRLAAADGRAAAWAPAEQALRDLRRAASGGGVGAHLSVHHRVGTAQLWQLRGDHRKALKALAVVDRLLCEQDVPWASFEATRTRARSLAALGRTEDALAQATAAITLAERLRWPHRTEWVRAEFRTILTDHHGPDPVSVPLPAGVDRRRLQALQQLSVIASRILDPEELTRVALDETIRILAAERAYLFLTHSPTGAGQADRLLPHLGRDADGNDLATLTDYGTTVVERVRLTREPVIVTGTDDGVALGSTSMLVHGLRSIMAAPLQFDGRLLGVVYLDSRVAKGMFTRADVGILTALTNHVAAALETARAAQLAVAVRAAEQQRDVADTLRRAMVRISGSLEPTEVLHRLHSAMARLLPSAASGLLRRDDTGALRRHGGADAPGGGPVIVGADLNRILSADFPVVGAHVGAELSTALGLPAPLPQRSWLGVPLRDRERMVGALVLVAPTAAGYGPAEANLAAMLAGEGMLAFDNAQLFARTEMLATTDALTRISNRGHFFAVAEQDVALASDAARQLSVVMLDIDHFKRINDQHGHQVGDEVIRTVAHRLRQMMRTGDRLGRYGGEEFAFLLNGPTCDAAGIAERLRARVAEEAVDTEAGPLVVTVSAGVATFDPAARTFIQALDLADAALYRAKQAGRNRVVRADPP